MITAYKIILYTLIRTRQSGWHTYPVSSNNTLFYNPNINQSNFCVWIFKSVYHYNKKFPGSTKSSSKQKVKLCSTFLFDNHNILQSYFCVEFLEVCIVPTRTNTKDPPERSSKQKVKQSVVRSFLAKHSYRICIFVRYHKKYDLKR